MKPLGESARTKRTSPSRVLPAIDSEPLYRVRDQFPDQRGGVEAKPDLRFERNLSQTILLHPPSFLTIVPSLSHVPTCRYPVTQRRLSIIFPNSHFLRISNVCRVVPISLGLLSLLLPGFLSEPALGLVFGHGRVQRERRWSESLGRSGRFELRWR